MRLIILAAAVLAIAACSASPDVAVRVPWVVVSAPLPEVLPR